MGKGILVFAYSQDHNNIHELIRSNSGTMNQLATRPQLDLSAEVSPSRLSEIITDGRAWTQDSIDPADAAFSPNAQAQDDLQGLME